MAAEPGRRHRIVSVVGTRPEAIKMAPLIAELATRRRLEQQVVLTGQHGGLAEMLANVPRSLLCELPFDPRARSARRLREALHHALYAHLRRVDADLVLVHGDTASAMAGAMAARECGLAVGHVEAGLRSFDLAQPWPEEGNRMAADVLADLLFAPTATAAANLRADWRVKGEVLVTGNTGIDALLQMVEEIRSEPGRSVPSARRLIVASCHRKENQGARLRAVCAALRRLADALPVDIAYLLHPNQRLRAEVRGRLGAAPHIRLLDPLPYRETVRLLDRCWLILTDSGGLQEEGPALGKPVLVLREVTERPEALTSANIALVGTDTEAIVAAVANLCRNPHVYALMARPSLPFGDGRAAPRIADAVEAWLASPSRASAGRAAARAPRAAPPAARSAGRAPESAPLS